MCAIAIWSPTRMSADTVVPMPVSSWCSKTVSVMSWFAAMSADCRANSASCADGNSRSTSRMRRIAIAEATSPPACPPMPSATANRCAPA